MPCTTDLAGEAFSRPRLESLLKRRFFFAESFEIYRTSAVHIADNRGLYDYGPPGCALQANIVNQWRNHFVVEENMMELDCTAITPEPVLQTSGHVDKFADWMCKDPVKGDYLRADHLVESVLESRLARHRGTAVEGLRLPSHRWTSKPLLAADMAEKAVVSITIDQLSNGSGTVELANDICTIQKVTRVENLLQYTPNVIEPSFGIGRIVYSLLEHVYWHRPQDVARGVLSLPALVAPTKALIVPLSNHASLQPIAKKLAVRLRTMRISNNVDASSTSIGKRYARNDELGTPFGITVDFDTVKDGSITLRERDSTFQVRSSEDDIVQAIKHLIEGDETWEQVKKRLPAFARLEED